MSSAYSFIFMQIKVILIRMALHLDSLWNRGTGELGNGQFVRFNIGFWMNFNLESRRIGILYGRWFRVSSSSFSFKLNLPSTNFTRVIQQSENTPIVIITVQDSSAILDSFWNLWCTGASRCIYYQLFNPDILFSIAPSVNNISLLLASQVCCLFYILGHILHCTVSWW